MHNVVTTGQLHCTSTCARIVALDTTDAMVTSVCHLGDFKVPFEADVSEALKVKGVPTAVSRPSSHVVDEPRCLAALLAVGKRATQSTHRYQIPQVYTRPLVNPE